MYKTACDLERSQEAMRELQPLAVATKNSLGAQCTQDGVQRFVLPLRVLSLRL